MSNLLPKPLDEKLFIMTHMVSTLLDTNSSRMGKFLETFLADFLADRAHQGHYF